MKKEILSNNNNDGIYHSIIIIQNSAWEIFGIQYISVQEVLNLWLIDHYASLGFMESESGV